MGKELLLLLLQVMMMILFFLDRCIKVYRSFSDAEDKFFPTFGGEDRRRYI